MAWPKVKTSSTARGLGAEHARERARLLPTAYGQLCPYHGVDPQCPGVMNHGDKLHLDHIYPRALGGGTGGNGRIAHGPCNQRAGSKLAHQILAARGYKPQPKPTALSRRSRQW